jgi:Flp pilus assembly protein TadD
LDGDERTIIGISNSLGVAYGRTDDHHASLERFEEVVATAQRLGDHGREGSAQNRRAIALRHLGRVEEAPTAAQQTIEVADRHQDLGLRAAAESNLALGLAAAGHHAAARASFERGRAMQRAFAQPMMEGEHLRAHAEFRLSQVELDRKWRWNTRGVH